MPHFSNVVDASGPLLSVAIAVSGPRLNAIKAAGGTVPPPQLARMLIDTGASHTSIDQRFVALLGLHATGSVSVLTPSTGAVPHNMSSYDVGLVIPGGHHGAAHGIPIHSVTACDLSAQGIDGLIGRDILAMSRLTYSGVDKFFYLSF